RHAQAEENQRGTPNGEGADGIQAFVGLDEPAVKLGIERAFLRRFLAERFAHQFPAPPCHDYRLTLLGQVFGQIFQVFERSVHALPVSKFQILGAVQSKLRTTFIILSKSFSTTMGQFEKGVASTPECRKSRRDCSASGVWYATVASGSFNWCPVRMHTTRS